MCLWRQERGREREGERERGREGDRKEVLASCFYSLLLAGRDKLKVEDQT